MANVEGDFWIELDTIFARLFHELGKTGFYAFELQIGGQSDRISRIKPWLNLRTHFLLLRSPQED